ncbi:glycosyltransferase family 1 protein [Rhizobium sp. CECT 9324]|uniref:glycosyltransferase family 4 protein n=1 Tax=Rhizobium sp. CECT 9324 TaxID=2845820 RepID=UPI001E43468D|nr:glycosyltransferase family 1 protein [Rhizobium sp. CECT 9324]CAH0342906.1 D-inositol-3-phosphate glycosyltransferase [Rhizobium sp. CECT 9324]
MTASFVVNGRYLTQRMTGVQRYARNVVSAIDRLDGVFGSVVMTPKSVFDPGFQSLTTVTTGAFHGHIWEQIDLPRAAKGKMLLNLCNFAPVVKRDQIICIHDANVFSAPDSYSLAFRAAYRSLQPMMVRGALKITTVSHAAARQLARYLPISLANIAILPNGHEHALSWDPKLASLPSELPVQAFAPPYLLAIGSRAMHKNMALLLEIATSLEEMGVNIVIAGGGGDIYRQELLTDRRNVYFCGRVSDDDLAYLLDNALCLAFPSFTEGFGLPIVEAMARGCPVVSSDCASMPEVCGDAALLASPFDPQQWIHHIRALTQSSGLRDDLIGYGREQCRHFSWKSTAEGYLEILDNPSRIPIKSAPKPPPQPDVEAVFVTHGRPDVVSTTVRHFVATQTLRPSSVIISCVVPEDAGDLVALDGVRVVLGPIGSSAQRNTALTSLKDGTEIVAFFDDDFFADGEWISNAAQIFRDECNVASLTGDVVDYRFDGVGVGFQNALKDLKSIGARERWTEPCSPHRSSMAFRVGAIGDLCFDERLVLQSWLEAYDFGEQLALRGHRLVKSSGSAGLHLGIKTDWTNGECLGYSQIANPIHLFKKGTMTRRQVAICVLRNVISNLRRELTPAHNGREKGKMKGNIRALIDAARGELAPDNIAAFGTLKTTVRAGREHRDA